MPEPVAPPKDEKKTKPVAAPTKEKSPVIFWLRNGGELFDNFWPCF